MTRAPSRHRAALVAALDEEITRLGLHDDEPPPREPVGRLRRAGLVRASALAKVELVDVDGVLSWSYVPPQRAASQRRAARRAAHLSGGQVIHEFGFETVPGNKVTQALIDLDAKLTPSRGLRPLAGGTLGRNTNPDNTPRTLLLIHGTFSKGDMYLSELGASADGRDFLARAQAHYGQVLSFDHPTLSVSPILNATELEAAFADYAGTVDVICHSRGGLVASWWLRLTSRKVGRIIFVGSPLEGTSLAAPARLRDALDGLANIADIGQRVATAAGSFVPPAAPLLAVAAGLMKVVGGILSVGANTPILDAGVALVPGLAAQSRVENNLELAALHGHLPSSMPELFCVCSNFEVTDDKSPWWQFWKRWRRPLDVLKDEAADGIFEHENDLVVDVGSMSRLCGVDIPKTPARTLDFKSNDSVHHTNYFAQPRTAQFLRDSLRIP